MSLLRISTLRTLPLMVLGIVSTNSTTRGYLYGAVSFLVKFWISFLSSSVGSKPALRMMVAFTSWPLTGSGTPVTAHSSTPGCSMRALSISKGLILYPEDLMMSSFLPTNQ